MLAACTVRLSRVHLIENQLSTVQEEEKREHLCKVMHVDKPSIGTGWSSLLVSFIAECNQTLGYALYTTTVHIKTNHVE